LDSFVEELFEVFFGQKTLAVCHLEVQNYMKKKQILIILTENVEKRHQDRYNELIKAHFQLCENAPRSKLPEQIKPKNAQIVEVYNSEGELQEEQAFTKLSEACVICYKTENLFVSKCDHLACQECWNTWLEKTLECPTCRARVRKNQIFPFKQEVVQK